MQQRLFNKQILLGVTGGIAAYKSADLVRRLREEGAEVRVVMTENAKQFITPLTLQAVSGHPVRDNLFDTQAEAGMGHIELGRWADITLIAPASADCIARLQKGEANDLLTTLSLVTKAPIALAPAMNQDMWKHTTTQDNVQALQAKGLHVFGPAEGSQACGDIGPGRMLEPLELVNRVVALFQTGRLSGKKILITAGPTREAIDPMRYISNSSSGKMGYALAEAAFEAGAQVTLISGPVNLMKPPRITSIDVISAEEMLAAVMEHITTCDIFFGVAAVADYQCQSIAPQKLAKTEAPLTLTLIPAPDIIATVAQLKKRPLVIGFAAQTENLLANAKTKLNNKKLDMIIANQISSGLGIGSDDNTATALWDNQQHEFPKMSKRKLARELISLVTETFFLEKT